MINKEEAKEKLRELVKQFSEGQKYWESKPEEDIKHQFIEPLFEEILGWDRKEVQKEPRVLKGRADYILKIANQEVLVIEAKKTNVLLDEDAGKQAVSYAYHRKIKFAVLTNFKDIRVYHALSNIKNIDKNLLRHNNDYFRINFKEFIDKFDTLWLLSRESFEKKEINNLLSTKDEKLSKPIDESLLQDLLKIREWLSKEIKQKKNYLEKEKIDEIVQIFIDRLIFIRSVEDRGLEALYYLKSLEADVRQQITKLQLFPYLLEKFVYFNQKYDSKLFEQGLLEKEGTFSDDVLRKVILALYFGVEGNQDKYMFDIIPGDLFGSIYEQYLGTILEGTEKRVKLDDKTGKRKKMGIYYTPSYIVDYIIKNTVGEYLKNKSLDEILQVKIVDPTCGSGSFLIRAFQEVINKIEELLKNGNKSEKWSTFKGYNQRLNLSQKITILTNCIYGVDLDEKAVELARLNLLLKVLEEEDQDTKISKLPNLTNVKCGNSLIDDIKVSDHAFNWNAQFPEVFKQGGFDIVIGNPPYFKILEGDPIKNTSDFKEIKDGMMNISAVFIHKGLKLIKRDGFMGMIVPKMLAFTESWSKVRKEILEKTSFKTVVDAGKAFEEVLLEQVIFCTKNEFKPKNKIIIGEIKDMREILETAQIEQEICIKDNKIYLESNEKAYGIKRKLETQGKRLGDVTHIFLGLGIQGMDNFIEEKKKDYLKVLRGNDIQRWFIRGCKYYNPQDKEMQKYKKEMQKFYQPHIVAQRIVAHIKDHIKLTVAFDREGLFSFNTVTNILVSDKKYSEEFIVALLNSSLIQYYTYKFIYQNAIRSMDFYEAYAKQIPIPKELSEKQQQKITSSVNQMLDLQKKYHDEKISGNEKERLKQQIDNVNYEINQEVYKLYGLTPEEIEIVEESIK
ncbi:MAG: N-6 DNA methylase [Nanoarchaeota archaeon]|nr:N-6 DNA methylase [Nanoarchaeota archaeon]